MKKIFIYLVCTMLAMAAMAQPNSEQQLLTDLRQVRDIGQKEKVLLSLCRFYRENSRYKESADHGMQLLRLREENGDQRGVANILAFLCDVYMYVPDTATAIHFYHRALKAMTPLDDPAVIPLAINLGVYHYNAGRYDSCLFYCRKAVQPSKRHGQQYQEARCYLFIGRCHIELDHISYALDTLGLALSIFQAMHQTGDVAVVLNNIGNTHIRAGHSDTAVSYILQSLDLSTKAHLQDVIAADLNDLVAALQFSPALDTSLLQQLNAARLKLPALPGAAVQAAILGNIGAGFLRQQQYDSALDYLQRAYQEGRGRMLPYQEAALLTDLGLAQTFKHHYAQALEALFRSVTLLASSTDRLPKAKVFSALSKTYLEMAGDSVRKGWPDTLHALTRSELTQRAAFYIRRSMAFMAEGNSPLRQENHRIMAEVYALDDHMDEAYKEFNRYMAGHDSARAVQTDTAIAVALRKYKFKAEMDKQLALAQASYRNRIWMMVMGAILAVIIVVAFFLLRRRYERAAHRTLIERSRQKILLNKVEEHFIDNGIISVDAFIRDREPQAASDYLVRFSHLFTHSLKNASESEVSLKDDLQQLRTYLDLQQEQFSEGPLTYSIQTDDTIDTAIAAVPPMIFQVLVENAVKYAFDTAKGGHIDITVKRAGNMIEGMVRDNGRGRTAARMLREQHDARYVKARASMGTALAEEIVRLAGDRRHRTAFGITDLFDERRRPAGTLARFTLPYKQLANTFADDQGNYSRE